MTFVRKIRLIVGLLIGLANSMPVQVKAYNANPAINEIIGVIDSVVAKGRAGMQVNGWACSAYRIDSIDVHVYADLGTTSLFLGSGKANLGNEQAVATACHAPGYTRHRFSFTVPRSQNLRYARDNKFFVTIYGIGTPYGAANLRLDNSSSIFTVTY